MKIVPVFISITVFLFLTGDVLAQREDYNVREARATAKVKTDLNKIRSRVQTKKLTFKVGYTHALERGVENITGGKKPDVSSVQARKQYSLAMDVLKIDRDARLAAGKQILQLPCSANLKAWDWRKQGKITPVRSQKCGNCWAYASLAAYESSYLIRNNKSVDGSEQYVVSNNNNGAGVCEFPPGGRSDLASEFLVLNGTTSETIMPDLGITGTADAGIASPYDALVWGWASPDAPGAPGVQNIKQSLCEHGAVASWVDAGGTFGAYIGGDIAANDVYNDDDDKEAGHKVGGHYVAIIGWDDTRGAWLIKNSWGQNWGFEAGWGDERGYGWIKYGTHGIGSWVSWVEARGEGYKLPPRYFEVMPKKKLPTPILKPMIIKPVVKPNIVVKPN
ncbi:MAG: hypothetical protein IPM59_14990 [Chloracidobacterium sp.]|nr:hypothetical protein [Chloracidobacterium sp.]